MNGPPEQLAYVYPPVAVRVPSSYIGLPQPLMALTDPSDDQWERAVVDETSLHLEPLPRAPHFPVRSL